MTSRLVFLVVFLVCVTTTLTGPSQRRSTQEGELEDYAGAKIFRVFFDPATEKSTLDNIMSKMSMETMRMARSHADVLLRHSKLEKTKDLLEKIALHYDVLDEDVQKTIETNSYFNDLRPRERTQEFNFGRYHPLNEINAYLDLLSEKYSDFVSTEIIGKTVLGNPLKILKVSSGVPAAPAIWIDAGTHAREWVSPAAVLYITSQLVEHRDTLPPKMREINYYILPVLNPDGYEFSRSNSSTRFWRKNRKPGNPCAGVDNNRNYDFHWGGEGTSDDPCQEIYRGPAPDSEEENKGVTGYIESRIAEFKGFLTFHSYSQFILIPFGYDIVECPNFAELKRVADIAAANIKKTTGAQYKVGNSAELTYPAAGGADDWAISKGIKYSYTVELRDQGHFGFALPESEIIPTSKDGFEVVKAVADAITSSTT